MDQQNKTALDILTQSLWEARRLLKDKQSSLKCTISYRRKLQQQLVRENANEVMTANECEVTAKRIADLESSIKQLGGSL